MKRKATEWVDPLIHRSVSTFPQKNNPTTISLSDMTLLQRSQRSMQECRKNQQNGLTYMHYVTFQIIF